MTYSLWKTVVVPAILKNRWFIGIGLASLLMFTKYVVAFPIPLAMTLVLEIIMRNKVFFFEPNFKREDFPATREGIHSKVVIWWNWLILDELFGIDISKIRNLRRGHVNVLFEYDVSYNTGYIYTKEKKIRDDFSPPLYEILQWRHDVYSKRTVEDNEV